METVYIIRKEKFYFKIFKGIKFRIRSKKISSRIDFTFCLFMSHDFFLSFQFLRKSKKTIGTRPISGFLQGFNFAKYFKEQKTFTLDSVSNVMEKK